MKRETILVIVLASLLTALPGVFAQGQDNDDHGRPSLPAPSDVIGPQLIAWSELQEPRPVSARTTSDQTKPEPNQQPVQTANLSKKQASAADSSVSQNVKDSKK